MVLLAYIDSGLHFPVAPVHFPLAVKSSALFTWNCQYAGVASRVQAVSVQHLKAAFGLGTDVIPHSEVDGLADHVRDFIGTEDPEIHVRMLATKICQAWQQPVTGEHWGGVEYQLVGFVVLAQAANPDGKLLQQSLGGAE